MSQIRAAVEANEQQRQGHEPQRPAIPEGSSGTGWLVR
jgi:hypothetical protein